MTVINTNTKAVTAQNALAANQRDLSQTMQQMSTGRRINSAADDAAGLAIRNKLTSQIRSLDMAVKNANDGISLLQTADAASGELTSMLQRMRELAIQSANDIYTNEQRVSLNNEVVELQAEMNNIIQNTQWNGMRILDGGAGSSGTVRLQVGAQGADVLTVDMRSLNSGAVASAQSIDISSQSGANSALATIDSAIARIDESRGRWGAVVNRLTHAADNASNVSLNNQAARSRIDDTDYAKATAELARALILDQAGAAMLSQANQQPYYVLALLR
jgi:flagellin